MTSSGGVRFGVVGTGRMAVRMARAFSLLREGRLVAVASGSPERAQRFAEAFGAVRAHDSVESLLADDAVDAVYIANATEAHAPTTLLSLRSGKSVLCEKPLATNAADARDIDRAARDSGRLVMEAMWTLFLPSHRRFAQLVEAHRDAGPLHLYADFGYPIAPGEQPRLLTPGPGAGVLLDRGVYLLALALKLFGAVERVEGTVGMTSTGVDEHATLLMEHSGGNQSQIAVSLRVLLQNRATVSSRVGLVSLEPPVIGAEQVRSFAHHGQNPADDPLTAAGVRETLRRWSALRRLNRLRHRGHGEHHSFGADPFLAMLTHFCELVQAGSGTSDVVPPALSTNVLALVDCARRLPRMPPIATT